MKFTFNIFCLFLLPAVLKAQMITGVWHGRISSQKVELKMIQDGDSITGTSYYYESATRYKRYSIKGYRDERDNSIVWWDEELLDDKARGLSFRKKPSTAIADINCPGGGVMKLDGKVYEGEKEKGDVHLDKTDMVVFKDKWDFVIENFTVGANDPDIIDSVLLIAQNKLPVETIPEETTYSAPVVKKEVPALKKEMVKISEPKKQEPKPEIKTAPLTIQQKFQLRQKILAKEIPVSGDSVQLSFYDNAEIDGDSISLFLNDQLIFQHIRLTGQAYVIKLATADLKSSNELIMVAENLGAIPPNTSYMVALVGDKRYEAQLASSEGSSAMIRLKKVQ
jgi:hypothetical protein